MYDKSHSSKYRITRSASIRPLPGYKFTIKFFLVPRKLVDDMVSRKCIHSRPYRAPTPSPQKRMT